jgi:hypothetical protein
VLVDATPPRARLGVAMRTRGGKKGADYAAFDSCATRRLGSGCNCR